MNETPCAKQVRSPALRFRGDLIWLMVEICRGFIHTCQWPEMGKACGPNSPFSVKLFSLFDHFITPWTLGKWKKVKSLSCVRLFATPWTVAYQAPPSMGFSRQEYWSGLPFPSLGDLPNPGIEPRSPTLQADFLTSWATREAPNGNERHEPNLSDHRLSRDLWSMLLLCTITWVPNLDW